MICLSGPRGLRLTFLIPQMSDMANNDLEKYAKALDKYEIGIIL